MDNTRKRNAIHSGIGDNDDLLVKQPESEDATEEFRYASRLRGKKRHQEMIYPEVPFEYGISYKGKTLETYNEKPYQFDINAHPEKVMEYCIEQTKELPVKRMWEARACFEAEVWRMNMQYALNWSGKQAYQKRNLVDYRVCWRASVTSRSISDARDFFTSRNGDFIGYGDASTWRRHSSGYIYDYSNVSRFSGIIAKQYYNLVNYEAEFDFKTILATNDQHVGGRDDDIVGIIFKAKDRRNFYMMLWERDERVRASWRAPDRLDGFNMLNSGESAWENRVYRDGTNSSSSMSSSEWNDYVNNRGWRRQHRRIYKVTNGVMRRVDTTPNSGTPGYNYSVKDLGNGDGWEFQRMQGIRVNSIGKRVEISVRRSSGGWRKIFDFETDWEEGSFGTVNVSQSVQFHRIEVREKNIINGCIPETGYHSMQQASKTLGTGYNYCIGDARKKASALKAQIPNVDTSSINFLSITGSLKDSSKGSITNPIATDENIVVKAGTHTAYRPISGRVPSSGWYEFDGIGGHVLTNNGTQYIKDNDKKAEPSTVTIEKIEGVVRPDSKYPTPTGTVIVNGLKGQIIARNNNPEDAGKKYSECFIRCGIVEVTPDHRDYNTGLLVFADIATVFKEDHAKFFNRIELINRKERYELLKPVKKDPPKPPPIEESEGGCVIEEEIPQPEEPIIECLNDFDFDGKKLVMWSCEFPIEKEEKCFANGVFAYQGWVTFNPLEEFNPNKWTVYELKPIESSIYLPYDELKWAGREDFDNAPVGTRVIMRTTEWYKAVFPSDIVNEGIVTSELNIVSEIPPAPEHFWHPEAADEEELDITKRMPDHFKTIHYLIDAWDNHPDVVIWFESNPGLTTDNVDQRLVSLAQEGRVGMPIVLTSNDSDKIIISCKEDPREVPWSSGKYIGYGKVNGKRPFFGNGSGKADMVNVSTQVVFFPDNLIEGTLEGPFIDIYDEEVEKEKKFNEMYRAGQSRPNPLSRIRYRLHSNGEYVDFYSDHTDAHVWYSDWYSNWIESDTVYQATMKDVVEIETPLELDPTNPEVSEDFNPDDTIIERIEVSSDNPFVSLWIEEDKGKYNGLLGTYYRFPLTSNIYEEEFQVKGDYEEWVQVYEIKPYMTAIDIPIEHEGFTVIEVKVGDSVLPMSASNGWTREGQHILLYGTAIQEGILQIKYSTGSIVSSFYLEKDLGSYIEVYVNDRLLEQVDYSFDDRIMTINSNQLRLNDWIKIQSYELNDFHDPTRRHYLGERKYAQLDFQEDIPTEPTNPNYNDEFYEGTFSYNWGYKRPIGMENLQSGFQMASMSQSRMFLPEKARFNFNVDMEIVYPVGRAIDISNFTGEWEQWDQQSLFREGETIDTHTGNGPGNWHGPPEPGYPEVTNLRNQNSRSGWYNPAHKDFTDYVFSFKVQARRGDDDMYGAIFKFDPETQNFYSFEWDGYWGLNPPSGGVSGVRGMTVYKNFCQNPEQAGVGDLTYNKVLLGRKDISWTPHTQEINEIKVSSVGNNIKVWTNDELQFDITDEDEPFLKGAWGPVTQSQPDTYFWDFWLQTYRRVTPKERASFRKKYTIEKDRPIALGTNPDIELLLDQQQVGNSFSSILTAYCNEVQVNPNDIVSVEYFIREDTSEAPVYFKKGEEQLGAMTLEGESRIHATIHGQYPDIGDPNELDIPVPVKPDIPELEPPTEYNPNDGFTISWNGYIYAPESGIYRFRATVNDGFRLWIRGQEVISEWHITGEPNYFPEYEASIYLEGDKWHSIRANYFDNIGQALIRLHWAQPGRGFQRISPNYMTPYLGYKLFAKVKESRPLPWHPMIHNGYYYHEDEEHYLYADKVVLKRTPNEFHEIGLEPRPQQGAAIIVRDNEGNNLRKVTFFDEDWNLTLENKEEFHGNGYAKYYLNYKGIDKDTLKVKVNGVDMYNRNYIFHEKESAIEFMEELSSSDEIEVRYKLLYSYYLDMNADIRDRMVQRDVSKIVLHSNYDPAKMKDMEIIYEGAKDTPFYRAEEVVFNPLLNHNHTGFLYITENHEQEVKDVTIHLSDTTLSDSGLEKVLLSIRVVDEYNNPCPNKLVTAYRDGEVIAEEKTTNDAGEIYIYDTPTPPANKVSTYQVTCESVMKETILNYYVDKEPKRYYLDISVEKLSIMAGVEDESIIVATLRDENWNAVNEEKNIHVQYRNTHGEITQEVLQTNQFGIVQIPVSGLHEKHGNMMIKVSYDMGFETTTNYIHLKVIGG